MPNIPEERLFYLIGRYLDAALLESEKKELSEYAAEHPQIWLLIARLEDPDQLDRDIRELQSIDRRRPLKSLLKKINRGQSPVIPLHRQRPAVALWKWAAVIFGPFLALSIVMAVSRKYRLQAPLAAKPTVTRPAASPPIDTLTGNVQATLTMTTSHKGQIAFIMPDRTRVWLNNSSVLTYPAAFTGNSRDVALKGEAYFEVAKDPGKPFHVRVKDLQVDVLGTNFNIAAYPEDNVISTTLLEGSVQLHNSSRRQLLRPKEQVVIDGKDWQTRSDIDTLDVVAWRSGYFRFKNTPIPEAMHQLSRWYGITIETTGPAKDQTCTATLKRTLTLSDILHELNLSSITYGKKLTVMK